MGNALMGVGMMVTGVGQYERRQRRETASEMSRENSHARLLQEAPIGLLILKWAGWPGWQISQGLVERVWPVNLRLQTSTLCLAKWSKLSRQYEQPSLCGV